MRICLLMIFDLKVWSYKALSDVHGYWRCLWHVSDVFEEEEQGKIKVLHTAWPNPLAPQCPAKLIEKQSEVLPPLPPLFYAFICT